jgi:hypothetical protein
MLMNVTCKMPKGLKEALERCAESEFTSVSSILKKAAAKYLQEQGFDWKEEPDSEKPSRSRSRKK